MVECRHEIEESQCSICNGRDRANQDFGGVASVHFDVGRVILETPYNADFVEQLKATIPGYARSWDPKDRVWLISSEWWGAAQGIVEEYFDLRS